MKMQEIEKLMDKFYDLYSDVDDQVFPLLLKFSKTDKNGFIKYVNAQKLGSDSYRPILYEAIMSNANGWEDFLMDQIKFIIEECELGNKDAEYEISSIYYLTNISDLESSFYTSTIEYLKTKLNSNNKEVKKAALEYIIDLHFDGKLEINEELKRELQCQLKDKIYNVRLYAFLNLKDSNLLPKGFKQTTIDKIRTKMSPNYRNYLKAQEIGRKAVEEVMKNNL